MRRFLIAATALATAALAPAALAATITLTDANGNVYTFSDVPCCYDWSLSAGTSCVDDCVIASNGGGPPIQTALASAARLGAEDGLDAGDLGALHDLLARRLGQDRLDSFSVYLRSGDIIDRVDNRGREATSPQALLCTDALLVYTVCTDSLRACDDLDEGALPDGIRCAAAPTDDDRSGGGRGR